MIVFYLVDTMRDKLVAGFYSSLPHHLISRFVGMLAHSKVSWVKSTFINWFIKRYNVDMDQAKKTNSADYENFNEFFTRELKDGLRPFDNDVNTIISPVDGCVSEMGTLREGTLVQAKGVDYSVSALLADRDHQFQDGKFATLYLAPKDYHRIHMPLNGRLTKMVYVPGRLFSVSPSSVRAIPDLFARNERVVAHFETDQGPMIMVLVGAMIVASIATQWAGVITPPRKNKVKTWDYSDQNIVLEKGAEMGKFMLGSTVILLFQNDAVEWQKMEDNIVMGQKLATVNKL